MPAGATPAATIVRLAGGGSTTTTYGASGPATSFSLDVNGAAADAQGDVYVVDSQGYIEKVTPQGLLTVIAGGGSTIATTTNTPGPASSYEIRPQAVAVDSSGNVYIADEDARGILKVTPSGQLSLVAGSNTASSSVSPAPGTTVPASSVYLDPYGVVVDSSGNIFVADEQHDSVYKVTPAGQLSIYAGNASYGTPTFGVPATSTGIGEPYNIALDSAGNLYITDGDADEVYKVNPAGIISLLAGGGSSSPSLTPRSATSVYLERPYGVAVDYLGNVYIAEEEFSYEVDKVTPSGQLAVFAGGNSTYPVPSTTPASPPTAYLTYNPWSVATDGSGNVYIADYGEDLIDEVNNYNVPTSPTGVTTTASTATVQVQWSPGAGPPPTSYTVTPIVNGVPGTPVTVSGTSYSVPSGPAGTTYSFSVVANNANGTSGSTASNTVTVPASPSASTGYWTVGGDGGVFSFGPNFYGSTGNLKLNQPVFAITSTADGKGYWFVARDGGVFSYGDAVFHGSVPALGIHVTDIVGMAADTATGGYWLVGSDGGVYAFDAPFDGSIPGLGQHVGNVVGIAATPDGGGYYLVTSTGAVYAFGDAKYQGGANTLAHLNAPIAGISVDAATGGYWLAGSDGGVYAYGAPFEGSAGGAKLNAPVVGISATTSGSGYYLVGSDGGVFSYNAPFLGSMGGKHLNAPMVGITVAG